MTARDNYQAAVAAPTRRAGRETSMSTRHAIDPELRQRTAVLVRRGARPARVLRTQSAARVLSAVLQPVVSIPAGLALLGALLGGHEAAEWAITVPTAVAVPPIALVVVARLTGRVTTLRITGRARVMLLAAGLVLQIVALIAVAHLRAPAPLLAALIGGLVGVLALALAQIHTNASVHTSVLTTYAGVLAFTHPSIAVGLALTAAGAAWSRVRTGTHTPTQAYAWPPVVGACAMVATHLLSVTYG